jgi:hypothetical protein
MYMYFSPDDKESRCTCESIKVRTASVEGLVLKGFPEYVHVNVNLN